ncbi:MAG: ATPase [Sphingobacteriales bacterium]|nr:MAG: ATPase [Sphingobacteriales bacterium]
MKRILVFLAIICSSVFVFAQEQKDIATEKVKVEGNCNMCKKRIENAAYIKGVKRAEWDKNTQMLTVVYRPSKTSADAVLNSVAKVGHSSEKIAAADADYKKLPECCQYKTNTCDH